MINTQVLNIGKAHLTVGDTMDFAIAKISTKGQIVIPTSMREDIAKGDEFLMVKKKGNILLKNMKSVAEDLKDDLKFAQKTDEAWKRIKAGKGIRMDFDEFINEMKKW